ncbi:pentapeptide repeat-containing protein [Nocardia sp. alder85J]|uniref:pentapeptide repeat-containing protein n=1 Tax=Nocardia sp. alder85J TaxID=2862949 RepID=UPI001CD22D6C|nr:pentapeptide repeat-containing protein [Nocardia sp. alder85J]MCX4092041.1 pentapeptide repeat-containing protein [Nocardia sp. alder85J]
MPRDLADLPYAGRLEVMDGEPEYDTDYEYIHLDDRICPDLDAHGIRFSRSAFTAVEFTGGEFRQARFDEMLMRAVRWVGSDLGQSGWLDTELVDNALTGVELIGARLDRIRFTGCKFESVNFRAARLRDVTFTDCLLRGTDFGEAALSRVSFPGSRLEDIALNRTSFTDVDLRGARTLGLSGGIGAMRGAIISTGQLFDLAPAFALAAGIDVRDA